MAGILVRFVLKGQSDPSPWRPINLGIVLAEV